MSGALRRLANLELLERLDKRTDVRALLAPYAAYCATRGLTVAKLDNDHASSEALARFFTEADADMPGPLIEALLAIDDLGDEHGYDALLQAASVTRIRKLPNRASLSAAQFALRMYLRYPDTFWVAYNCQLCRRVRNFVEYSARHVARLGEPTPLQLAALAGQLRAYYRARGRTSWIDLRPVRDRDVLQFVVGHGRLFRHDLSLVDEKDPSRTGYRPRKYDVVTYDQGTGQLLVNASTPGERTLYRAAFGQVFFGSENHFGGDAIYTLEPLQAHARAALDPTGIDGLEWVRLREVWIAKSDGLNTVDVCKSADVFTVIESRGHPDLGEGRLVRAVFELKLARQWRTRRLQIRPSNVVIYDRRHDGEVFEAFLTRHGYRLPNAASVGLDEELLRAAGT